MHFLIVEGRVGRRESTELECVCHANKSPRGCWIWFSQCLDMCGYIWIIRAKQFSFRLFQEFWGFTSGILFLCWCENSLSHLACVLQCQTPYPMDALGFLSFDLALAASYRCQWSRRFHIFVVEPLNVPLFRTQQLATYLPWDFPTQVFYIFGVILAQITTAGDFWGFGWSVSVPPEKLLDRNLVILP